MNSQTKKTNQQGLVQILLILGIVAAVGVIGYVLFNQSKIKKESLKIVNVPEAYKSQYQESSDQVTQINDSGDLAKTSETLEVTDTTEIDSELSQLDSDLSSF